MDQSPKPIAYFELNMRFEDGTYNQITIDAEKDNFTIFYRETETDHTNDTTKKHTPQRWFHQHQLHWTHTSSTRSEGGRPGAGVRPGDEAPDPGLREEETHEGFGDEVRQGASG